MVNNQRLGAYLVKNSVCWLSKVNVEKKFGVAFFCYGMLTEAQKDIKNEQITCTKPWDVCKKWLFPLVFSLGVGRTRHPNGLFLS